MSHGVSFFAVSLFLFVWHPPRPRSYGEWALLGFTSALMTLVRWQNLLYLSILVTEAAQSICAVGGPERAPVVRQYAKGWVVLVSVGVVAFAPQMLAWNTLYGAPLAVPQGGGFFDLIHPNLVEYLFSTRHGLYTWHPITLLATLGLVRLWRRDRNVTMALVTALLLQWYLNSATADWWAHGSFGARRFVSATPLLALGMAGLVESATQRFRRGHLAAVVAVAALVLWNLLFDMQYSWGFIPRDEAVSLHQLTLGKLEMILELIGGVSRPY